MNKYMRRLFFTNFLIFLIFAVIFLTLVVYQSAGNQSTQMQNANDTTFLQTVKSIDEQLKMALSLVNQLSESPFWRQPEVLNVNEDDYNSEVMIRDELKRVTNVFSDAMFTISAVNTMEERVIDKDYSMDASKYFDNLKLSGITAAQIAENADNSGRFTPYSVFSINNEIFIARPVAQPANKRFFILCHIRSDYFSNLPIAHQNGAIIMITRDKECLYSNSTADFSRNLLEWSSSFSGTPSERQRSSLAGYTIISERFEAVFANCVVAIPLSPAVSAGSVIWYIFLTLAFALLTIPAARLISKMIYRPIDDMVSNIEKIEGIPSGQDELLYVEKTIKKISLVNDELRDIVKVREQSLKNRFLKEYLLGYEILDKEEAQKYNIPEEPIYLALFEVIGFFGAGIVGESTNDINANTFYLLTQLISATNHCDIVHMSYDRYCLMVYGDCPHLKTTLSQFILDVDEELGFKIVAAISGEAVSDVSTAYLNTSEMLDIRYSFGEKLVITPGDYESSVFDSYYYPFELERDIINNVLGGKRQQAELNIRRLLEENLDKRCLDKEAKTRFVMALSGTVSRILERVQIETEEVFGEGFYVFADLKLSMANGQLWAKAPEMFALVMDAMENREKNLGCYVAQRITDYIKNNYSRDISLRDMAENLGYSISYTSNMFKQHLNENFKDYLNRYRVEVSKQLMMENNNILIKEIINQIGINSEDTFIRIFKRYEGMTPGKYIKTLSE